MSVPAFNIDGVIPPFVGANGPGGHPQELTPYATTALEVVSALGTSENRRAILRGWIAHRARLRELGFTSGFQWLDGSFVEAKEPHDLDVVSYVRRPPAAATPALLLPIMQANPDVFDRAQAKDDYQLDAFFVDMDATPETVVQLTAYWLGLFSHRREDMLWKGMLKVDLDGEADDQMALEALDLWEIEALLVNLPEEVAAPDVDGPQQ